MKLVPLSKKEREDKFEEELFKSLFKRRKTRKDKGIRRSGRCK